jgi:hypothetical protein
MISTLVVTMLVTLSALWAIRKLARMAVPIDAESPRKPR